MANSLKLSTVGRSNELYSAEEEALIRHALITAERARIAAEQQLVKLREQVARYNIALAPHKKLPEDVLRHIFNLSCQDETLYLIDENVGSATVIQLSRVCSAWRSVALNMPHLWADVNLDYSVIGYNDKLCNHSPIDLARLWLVRGGSVPRSLYVDTVSYWSERRCDPSRIQQFGDSFPYRRLHLRLCWKQMASLGDTITPRHMLPLESLELGCGHDKNFTYLHFSFPANLPNLTRLSLDEHFGGSLEKLITAVPWHNLEYLRLSFPICSTTCLSVILCQGSSLAYCRLEPDKDTDFDGVPIAEPIVMPNMKILHLLCQDGVDIETLNHWVVTPAVVNRKVSRDRRRTKGFIY